MGSCFECKKSEFRIEADNSNIVKISMPRNIVENVIGTFLERKAVISDSHENTLWAGEQGEEASFYLNAPAEIKIDLGRWANEVRGKVEPGCSYMLIQKDAHRTFVVYRLIKLKDESSK